MQSYRHHPFNSSGDTPREGMHPRFSWGTTLTPAGGTTLAGTHNPGDSWKALTITSHTDAANEERCAAGPCRTNKEHLVGDVSVGATLAAVTMRSWRFCSPQVESRARNKTAALDFIRANFGLFADLLGRIPWEFTIEGRGVQESR